MANILIARLLGPEKFGVYQTLLSVALVTGGFVSFGLGPVLTRQIAAAEAPSQGTVVRTLGCWSVRFCLSLSIFATPIVFVWFVVGPGAPVSTLGEQVGALAIIPLFALSTLSAGILSGLSRVAQSQSIGNLLKNGVLFLGAALLLLLDARHASHALFVQVLSFSSAIVIALFWIRSASPEVFAAGMSFRKESIDGKQKRALRRAARHFLVVSMAWLALGRLDVVVVNVLAGTTQAGLFGAAARLGQVAGMMGLIWLAWLQPRISARFHRDQQGALQRILRLALLGATLTTGVVVAIAWLIAPFLISLIGPEFEDAVTPFRWLVLGYLPWSASVPFYAYLAMTGNESILSRALWAQVIVTAVISIPLVHYFGALGGALSSTAGFTFGSVVIVIFAVSRLRRDKIHVW